MTEFDDFSPVRICSDRFTSEGAPRGAVGYIVETHPDGALMVEVSNGETGETLALITADRADLEAVGRG